MLLLQRKRWRGVSDSQSDAGYLDRVKTTVLQRKRWRGVSDSQSHAGYLDRVKTTGALSGLPTVSLTASPTDVPTPASTSGN
jgi:hypothetical protein